MKIMPGAVSEGLMTVKSDLRRVGEVFSSEGYKDLGSIFVMGCSLFTFLYFQLDLQWFCYFILQRWLSFDTGKRINPF